MDSKKVTVSVAEVTFIKGRQKSIRIFVDGQNVNVPVGENVYAYFDEQFLRKNPSPLQQKRFATIMNVLRAAYLKGISDGSKN